MTKNCTQQNNIIDYFYGEMHPAEEVEFERHVRICPECRKQLSQMEEAAEKLRLFETVHPTKEQLKTYHRNLKKLYRDEFSLKRWLKESYDFLIIKPPMGVRLAKVAVVLMIGILIGISRYDDRQQAQAYSEIDLKNQVLSTVIFESEFLLLQIANSDNVGNLQEIMENVNFMNLIQKTIYLKEHARSESNERLYDLLEQLELILLELANFDMKNPEQELDYLRENIDDLHIFVELRQVKKSNLM